MFFSKAFFKALGIILVGLILSNVLSFRVEPSDFNKMLAQKKKQGDWVFLIRVYGPLVQKEPLNTAYLYEYLNAKFYQLESNDLELLKEKYQNYTNSVDSVTVDIGNFVLGMVYQEKNQHKIGLEHFFLVKNKNLKHLNNLIGDSFYSQGLLPEAEKHYLTEMNAKGDILYAVKNLEAIYLERKELSFYNDFLQDPEVSKHLDPGAVIYYKFLTGSYTEFFILKFKSILSKTSIVSIVGLTGAVAILLYFLLGLNLFSRVKYKLVILCFLAGCILAIPFYLYKTLFVISFLDEMGDFFNAIIGYGLFLNIPGFLLKVIPLIFFIKYVKNFKEPFHLILYSSLIGFGFGVVEALAIPYEYNYVRNLYAIKIITAMISHAAITCTITYAWILNKFRYDKHELLRIIACLMIAIFMSGLYEFSSNSGGFYFVFTMAFTAFVLILWVSIINSSLNHSSNFKRKLGIKFRQVFNRTIVLLGSLIVLEYGLMLIFHGSLEESNLFINYLLPGFLLVFTFAVLSRIFQTFKGEWLNYFKETSEFFVQNQFLLFDSIDNAIGQVISLSEYSDNEVAYYYLPNEGIVLRRYIVEEDTVLFLVRLKRKATLEEYHGNYVFLKLKELHQPIVEVRPVLAGLYLIPPNKDPTLNQTYLKELAYAHWVQAQIHTK